MKSKMSDISDVEEAEVAVEKSVPKKAAKSKSKPKKPSTHPPVSEMCGDAIKSLKHRGGSSTQAIKKFIEDNYDADATKLAPHIRHYLKKAVENGGLVQTKGKGANGSFKLKPKEPAKKRVVVKEPASPKKTVAKKTTENKKAKAESPKKKKAKVESPKKKKAKVESPEKSDESPAKPKSKKAKK